VAQARSLGSRFRELYGDGPGMARTAEVMIAAYDGGSFGARVLVPRGDRRAIIVCYTAVAG
jgi:acetyl esterase